MDNRKRKRWSDYANVSKEYLEGAKEFVDFIFKDTIEAKVGCPCRKCLWRYFKNREEIYEDLICNGIVPSYELMYFKEKGGCTSTSNIGSYERQRVCMGDDMTGLIRDTFREFIGGAQVDGNQEVQEELNTEGFLTQQSEQTHPQVERMEEIMKDAHEELYPGCQNFSKLSFILHLYHGKCVYGWSNESFDYLLKVVNLAFPNGGTLPKSSKEAKQIVKKLSLDYEKIHACPNDCMLFWKEKVYDDFCSICGISRWKSNVDSSNNEPSLGRKKKKKKKVPAKVLRYFPLKPRLQKLFASSKTSDLMRWHESGRTKDGILRHPADSDSWKEFDSLFTEFGKEPRNIRLVLATDGVNPFGSMRSTHSTWPVIVTPINLPPWHCMKEPFMMLSLLIPGPKAPGNDIDIFLQPLIEELIELWEMGVETYDASSDETFQLHAAVMWTINDFPAYGNLSGWCTYGQYACPYCNIDASSRRLKHGKKFCFMSARRHLPSEHEFRFNARAFDGTMESRPPPSPLSGSKILEQLENIEFTLGKTSKDISGVEPKTWKKKSIFFKLPYWEYNMIRHNIDVMHLVKNVCDNFVNTFLNNADSKDNASARKDLQELGIRSELWPQQRESGRIYLPPSQFVMSPHEKKHFFQVLKNVKFPDGYASNIARSVRNQRELSGLKSHDCHVLMQHLLPIALRGALPKKVTIIVNEICAFFQVLCGKSLQVEEIDALQEKIVLTLCHMEKLFPPSFFTIMVHLILHLTSEAKLGGPVHYRWMYPIERYLCTLKSYVRNRAQPEGSIAEAYIVSECLAFCSQYLHAVEISPTTHFDSGPRQEMQMFPTVGRPYGSIQVFMMDDTMWTQAHRYVLFNCDCEAIESFRDDHIDEIKRKNYRRRRTQLDLDRLHSDQFVDWFNKTVNALTNDERITDNLRALARGPSHIARRFQAFDVNNGYRFRVKEYERDMNTQNSGMIVIAKTQSYASISDSRPILGDVTYYGVLTDIIELNYYEKFKIILFRGDWVDVTQGTGVKKDELGFTLVNFSHLIHTGHKRSDDPFVFPTQVEQVIYVEDPRDHGWFIPRLIRPRDNFDMGGDNIGFGTQTYGLVDTFVEENDNDSLVRNDIDGTFVDTNVI